MVCRGVLWRRGAFLFACTDSLQEHLGYLCQSVFHLWLTSSPLHSPFPRPLARRSVEAMPSDCQAPEKVRSFASHHATLMSHQGAPLLRVPVILWSMATGS